MRHRIFMGVTILGDVEFGERVYRVNPSVGNVSLTGWRKSQFFSRLKDARAAIERAVR